MCARNSILIGLLALSAALFAWIVWPRVQSGATTAGHLEQATAGTRTPYPSTFESPVEAFPSSESGLALAPILVRGIIVDIHGAPQAGVAIGLAGSAPQEALAASDSDGKFEVTVDHTGATLVATEASYFTVEPLVIASVDPRGRSRVVVAPAVELAGFVVDQAGHGLESDISLFLAADSTCSDVSSSVKTALLAHYNARSGFQGGFRFGPAPAVPGAYLLASARGYEANRVRIPEGSCDTLRVVLQRANHGNPILFGLVLHRDGRLAAMADVSLDCKSATTDKQGEFTLMLDNVPESAALIATARGFLPAIEPRYGEVVRGSLGDPKPIRLVLGGPTLSIRGRVLDQEGNPPREFTWSVGLADPTKLSSCFGSLESRCAVERGLRGRTGETGSFELTGLAPRSYTLEAFEHRTFITLVSDPIPAGTSDVVLRAERGAMARKVIGTVSTLDGEPLADVRVFLEAALGDSGSTFLHAVVTNEAGRFELEDVPRRFVELVLEGESIAPLRVKSESLDLDMPLELRVRRRAHFKFEFAADSAPRFHAIGLLDSEGRPERILGGRFSPREESNEMIGFPEILKETHSASEGSHTLVFLVCDAEGDHEVARRNVNLVAGEVTVVHL